MPVNRIDEALRRELHTKDAARRPAYRPPRLANTAPALGLTLPDALEFAGVVYTVAPVPWQAGQELIALKQRLDDAESGSHHERATLRRLTAIYGTLVVPRGKVRRAVWWVTRNPFRYSSDAEIGQLLAFFCGCRMKSRVRYPEGQGSLNPSMR